MQECFEPFDNVEEVWFWYCACLQARADGIRSHGDFSGLPRSCEVADIQRVIKRLKADGYLNNRQLRVMYAWGCLHYPPHYDRRAKRSQIELWDSGMKALQAALQYKGILPADHLQYQL